MGKRITDAATEPFDLAKAKLHRRIDVTADDELVTSLITAARQWCEKQHHRAYITQTWQATYDCFPCKRYIELNVPPLQSITSVQYYDTAGVQRTWDASNYVVDTVCEPGRVCLAPGVGDWPTTQSRRIGDTVSVTFVAGWGDAATDVPDDIKAAVYWVLGTFYENRESLVTGTIAVNLPLSVQSILDGYNWGYVA